MQKPLCRAFSLWIKFPVEVASTYSTFQWTQYCIPWHSFMCDIVRTYVAYYWISVPCSPPALQLSPPSCLPPLGMPEMMGLLSRYIGVALRMQLDTLSWQPATLVNNVMRLWRGWYLVQLTAQATKSLEFRFPSTLSAQISSNSKWLLSTVLEWGCTQMKWK